MLVRTVAMERDSESGPTVPTNSQTAQAPRSLRSGTISRFRTILPVPGGNEAPANASASAAGAIGTGELFGSLRELIIEHAGFSYRLRITQNNKLILTK